MHHLKRELDIPVDFHHTPTRAHVTLYGDDSLPQIVCLHGIGSTGQESYGPLAEHLSQKYQLVAPDWIGCGGTTRLLGPKDFYSSDYCSEWLANFFNAAKNQGLLRTPVNVLASSMSAIGVAKSYPMIKHMLDKIIFINPAGFDDRINSAFAFWLTNPVISQRMMAKLVLWNPVWKYIMRWPAALKSRLREGLLSKEFDVLVRYAKAGFFPWGKMKNLNLISHLFQRITHSVVMLYGGKDELFYKQAYIHIVKGFTGWRSKPIAFSGHNLLTEDPQSAAQWIDDALQK